MKIASAPNVVLFPTPGDGMIQVGAAELVDMVENWVAVHPGVAVQLAEYRM
jgi:hypothetical protein